MDFPDAYKGEEASQQQTPAYLYILEHRNDGSRKFLTNFDKPITVSGLPVSFGAAEPQAFICGQITHGEITTSASFEKRTIAVILPVSDERLRRFFVTGAAVKIAVYIIRVTSDKIVRQETIDYGQDCCLVNSGIVGATAFSKTQIECEVAPEPLLTDETVPRLWFQRTCNHMLGHPVTCTVNLAAFTHEALIDSVVRDSKKVTLSIDTPGLADYFRSGQIRLNDTGEILAIVTATVVASKVVLTLRTWSLALVPGNTVFVTAGCRRNTEDCNTKFANLANFGGFPFVPARNPITAGVG